jgi:hypothetical protein
MDMQHIEFAFQKKGGTFNAYGKLFPPCQVQVFMTVLTKILEITKVL